MSRLQQLAMMFSARQKAGEVRRGVRFLIAAACLFVIGGVGFVVYLVVVQPVMVTFQVVDIDTGTPLPNVCCYVADFHRQRNPILRLLPQRMPSPTNAVGIVQIPRPRFAWGNAARLRNATVVVAPRGWKMKRTEGHVLDDDRVVLHLQRDHASTPGAAATTVQP